MVAACPGVRKRARRREMRSVDALRVHDVIVECHDECVC